MKNASAADTNSITDKAQSMVADIFDVPVEKLEIMPVAGGYSRNRRALVGIDSEWVFVKEVDVELLPGSGGEELRWLEKDYLCARVLRDIVPAVIPEWSRLEADGHVLVMTAYLADDGWLWSPPEDPELQAQYIQAVIDATKNLEAVQFDRATIEKLDLHPYLRDEIAHDDGLVIIGQDEKIRSRLRDKYRVLAANNPHSSKAQYEQMLTLLDNKDMLQKLVDRATHLIKQPNDYFGHCDVRSDNLTYNTKTGEVKFIDWNWASFVPKGFGATEFLVDMARRGADVKPWADELNLDMLAATVGFFAKRSLKDPLAPGNTLRDMQAESAAAALELYNLAASS